MISIITRQQWHAHYGQGAALPEAMPEVVLHHSYRPALDADDPAEDERRAVVAIERHHVHTNHWAGIGYNFLIAPSGRIYEGRGWGHRGAHAAGANGRSVGICAMIDGSVTPPSPELIEAVRALIGEGVENGHLQADYRLVGHRDVMDGRTCPGKMMYSVLQQFRHDAGSSADGDSGHDIAEGVVRRVADTALDEMRRQIRRVLSRPGHRSGSLTGQGWP